LPRRVDEEPVEFTVEYELAREDGQGDPVTLDRARSDHRSMTLCGHHLQSGDYLAWTATAFPR
jgi:hypothetical protein